MKISASVRVVVAVLFALVFETAAAATPAAATSARQAGLRSFSDQTGTTTYWGEGASYEIAGPGITVFFLTRGDGAIVAPMIRVAYVGRNWINVKSVTFTVGGRIFGPYADLYSAPTRIEAGQSLVVESLLFNVDTDEKWGMLDAIADSADLGRPVIAVFESDAPYGIEVDRTAKHATRQVLRGYRVLAGER